MIICGKQGKRDEGFWGAHWTGDHVLMETSCLFHAVEMTAEQLPWKTALLVKINHRFLSAIYVLSLFIWCLVNKSQLEEGNIFLKVDSTIGQPLDVAYDSLFSCWPLKASWWQLQLWLQPRDREAWDDLTANYFLVTCRGTSLMPHNLSPSTTPSTKLWLEMETSEDVKMYVCCYVAETYWLAEQSWPKSRDLRKWRSSLHDKSNGDLE